MVEQIGEILKNRIINAVYVDRIAGIVSVTSYKEKVNGKDIIYKLPTSCNVEGLNCGEDNDNSIKDLVPDSKKRSVIFFEDLSGASILQKDRRDNVYYSTIRMVAWLNQQKLGKNQCNVTGPVMNDIVNKLQTVSPFNEPPFTKIKISVVKIIPKTPSIFKRYSFKEMEKQYLMYPYDYFALDVKIQYNINNFCLEDFILDEENQCN